MVHQHRMPVVIAVIVCIGLSAGCVTSQNTNNTAGEAVCAQDECVQPPVRRADLVEHLRTNQDRILARAAYRSELPPPISEIIYGPLPDGHLRDGPTVENADGEPFDGELNWHRIDFDDVYTDSTEHNSLRGRDVSGAHCTFARQPNRLTPVFALLVLHHRDRGDVLYFGGQNQPITRIDTVPLTDHHPSRLRIDTDSEMICAFRDDQNQHGSLIIPFEYADVAAPSNGPHWAVFTLTVSNRRDDTGRTTTVPRTTGLHAEQVVQVEVPLYEYDRPRSEFIGSYTSLYDALDAADEQIQPSDFRLRPEFIYPTMPYRSYLNTGKEEFCPVNTRCETPPKHLDKDRVPPIEVYEDTDEDEPVGRINR